MQQTPLITCQNLNHSYGNLTVIDDLSFAVHEGEFVALLGESGCGKTTALRLIAGFERPDSGTIIINERQMTGPRTFVSPEHRRIGMVFQDYALFPHLTVTQNVAYGLRNAADRASRVTEMLSLVGLAGLGERMPGELSGGQQQRVALARALAPNPDVILLDEPFSNLDASLRVRLRLELREILAQTNVTTVFVTHDQEEALSLADRVAVMRDGNIAQIAAPEVLYRLPATREIAQFVGEANFVPGQADGETVTCALGGPIPLPLCRPANGPVDVMLRPEWITVQHDPAGTAEVVRRMYFGHDQLMIVRVRSTGQVLQVRLGPDQTFKPGDSVTLTVNMPVLAFPRNNDNNRRLEPVMAPLPTNA